MCAVQADRRAVEEVVLDDLDRQLGVLVGIAHAAMDISDGLVQDLGHLCRAGGLAAIQHFHCKVDLADKSPLNQNRANPNRDLETIRFGVQTSNLRAGDVLVLGSVSGKNRVPVELAIACRERGVKTIGLTSLAYTKKVESQHPSGKKLCDVVDVVIDNGAPYGDAAVDIPGYAHKLLPVSGVACATIGHMLWGRVMEQMAAAGKPATVFQSLNRSTGVEDLKKAEQQYNERGY